MSETRRSHRLATDFSIARILASDEPSSSSSSSSSGLFFTRENRVPICPCCPSGIISVQEEKKSYDRIAEDREGFICSPSERIERQFDDKCQVDVDVDSTTNNQNPVNSRDDLNEGNDLPWLHCTRYRPPRLPKRSSAGKISKRRPGKHPRIPFTPFQLQILEDKYRKGAYLARRDVVQLSLILRLPQSRVKIWFQNRRARERRESLQSSNEIEIKSDKEDVVNNT